MIHEKNSHTSISQFLSMLLFFLFLFCSAFTILIGSRIYENIRERNQHAFQTDTALAYITNKVRQNDTAGFAALRSEDDIQILVLTSMIEDTEFETWIYQMDDGLYELFTTTGSGLDRFAGQRIMDCDPLLFSIHDASDGSSMLTITLTNEERHAALLLRSNADGGNAL